MKNYILSTCGTSLLSNAADNHEKALIRDIANIKNADKETERQMAGLIEKARRRLDETKISDLEKVSAELNALYKYYKGDFSAYKDYHLLLTTDTWLGNMTGEILAAWLRSHGQIAEVKRQPDLQTNDVLYFQSALSDLVVWCEETIPGYRESQYNIVFNLTGGFKSVLGFMQTLAMFYADEAIYVFESGDELLRLPKLPVAIDAENLVESYLPFFRKTAMGIKAPIPKNFPETLVLKIGKETILSPYGWLLWNNSRKAVYAKRLYESPIPGIRYAQKFINSTGRLKPDRMILVNERMDQLARFLESGGKYNLKSFDFKQLSSELKSGSTHEIDAWADGCADRIYGHFEEAVFVVDELDLHLRP
ncbi:MAG: putative CRISPR-associated protein [Calditrichaceae bacterium]